ncbi:Hypothetical protein MexAM1_META2p0423 (plasmid) [Methylorubrum extorquens AM1]|uniref:Uncharacterized protein n=1 Tax=Methylorubrum extorquens (strain ATCC 14718 / DSM 1338 / JCM 2805 / NCIMB 9133 / AM1) TaxID=272630 RepID=C5B493_METEA|nr:Hypothetical protein MexAM1_META2p0423 [Methylorubrum extorquens AM1]
MGLPFPSECHGENDLHDLARRLRDSWGCHSRLGAEGTRYVAESPACVLRPLRPRDHAGRCLHARIWARSWGRHSGTTVCFTDTWAKRPIDGPLGAGSVCPASGRRSWGCHSRPTY